MYFLFMKLMDIRYRNDVFLALESVDITRTTFFQGYNLQKVLRDEIPLFKGFFAETDLWEKETIVVTAYVDEKQKVKELLQIIREAGIDIDHQEILRVLLLPVEFVFDNKLGTIEKN